MYSLLFYSVAPDLHTWIILGFSFETEEYVSVHSELHTQTHTNTHTMTQGTARFFMMDWYLVKNTITCKNSG